MLEGEPFEGEREEALQEHVKSVGDIIGSAEAKKEVIIPEGEGWVAKTLSHVVIEVPSDSSLSAEIAQDCTIITHPGAKIDIPEGNQFEVIQKAA